MRSSIVVRNVDETKEQYDMRTNLVSSFSFKSLSHNEDFVDLLKSRIAYQIAGLAFSSHATSMPIQSLYQKTDKHSEPEKAISQKQGTIAHMQTY